MVEVIVGVLVGCLVSIVIGVVTYEMMMKKPEKVCCDNKAKDIQPCSKESSEVADRVGRVGVVFSKEPEKTYKEFIEYNGKKSMLEYCYYEGKRYWRATNYRRGSFWTEDVRDPRKVDLVTGRMIGNIADVGIIHTECPKREDDILSSIYLKEPLDIDMNLKIRKSREAFNKRMQERCER